MADVTLLKGIAEKDRQLAEGVEAMFGPEPSTVRFAKNLFWGRVFVATQHSAKGKSKIVNRVSVTELAVIGFADGCAMLPETAPGVTIDEVRAATEAELVIPGKVPQMAV